MRMRAPRLNVAFLRRRPRCAGGVIVTPTSASRSRWLWRPPIETVGALNVTAAKLASCCGVNVFAPVESAG